MPEAKPGFLMIRRNPRWAPDGTGFPIKVVFVLDEWAGIGQYAEGSQVVQVTGALDEKVAKFCAEYALSPQQTRIFTAMMDGAISNEALARRVGITEGNLRPQLRRISTKTMTVSRTELLYLFYEGRRGE